MKILHISESIKGGISTYLTELYENQTSRYKFYFFLPENQIKYMSDKFQSDTNTYLFKRKKRNIKFFISFYVFIFKNIKKIDPDIIHLHSTFAGFFVRLYYLFLLKRPKIIYCSHGWSFLMEITYIKRKIYLIIEKILSIKTDIIINISDFEYNQSIRLGISKNKSVKILNTISNEIKKHDKKVLNYIDGKINFLFLGRLDRQKGFDKLCNFFKNNNKHALHVVGDYVVDEKFNYLDTDNIFFYGWVDQKKIHNYYIESDVVIIPSRWEGFGLISLEAMKYSKPILASNRGALIDIVEDNGNGFIFDFNNFNSSLTQSINDLIDAGIKKIGKSSYQLFNKKYSKNNMPDEINDLYEKLLN